MLEMVSRVIDQLGFEVITACSGADLLEKVEVTDVAMPWIVRNSRSCIPHAPSACDVPSS
jgi:hypothetical protein